MLFTINSEDDQPDLVKVLDSQVGKGVFAARPYPRKSVIGEITGQIFPNPYTGTNYTFEAKDGFQLEPYELAGNSGGRWSTGARRIIFDRRAKHFRSGGIHDRLPLAGFVCDSVSVPGAVVSRLGCR